MNWKKYFEESDEKMKVLQINSVCGIGSTGRIATDLADFLREKGHTCKIDNGQKNYNRMKGYLK